MIEYFYKKIVLKKPNVWRPNDPHPLGLVNTFDYNNFNFTFICIYMYI